MQTQIVTVLTAVELDRHVRDLWRALLQSRGEPDAEDIFDMTCGEGVPVYEFVEYVDSFYPGILEEWAQVCVAEARSYIEERLKKVPAAEAKLKNPLGGFTTCDPDVALAMFKWRFKAQFPSTLPAQARYALHALIFFGCEEYALAVEHAQCAWCYKQMPNFHRAYDQNDLRALELHRKAEVRVAKQLVPLLCQRLKQGR